MMRRLAAIVSRLKRTDRGAVAVEFALVAPFLIVLMYGIFETGRYFWWQNQLDFAVQEASRYGGITPDATTADIVTKVEEHLVIDATNVVVTVEETIDDVTGMTFREVQASLPFDMYALDEAMITEINVVARSKYLVVE